MGGSPLPVLTGKDIMLSGKHYVKGCLSSFPRSRLPESVHERFRPTPFDIFGDVYRCPDAFSRLEYEVLLAELTQGIDRTKKRPFSFLCYLTGRHRSAIRE
jgi:hypothetical protein